MSGIWEHSMTVSEFKAILSEFKSTVEQRLAIRPWTVVVAALIIGYVIGKL